MKCRCWRMAAGVYLRLSEPDSDAPYTLLLRRWCRDYDRHALRVTAGR